MSLLFSIENGLPCCITTCRWLWNTAAHSKLPVRVEEAFLGSHHTCWKIWLHHVNCQCIVKDVVFVNGLTFSSSCVAIEEPSFDISQSGTSLICFWQRTCQNGHVLSSLEYEGCENMKLVQHMPWRHMSECKYIAAHSSTQPWMRVSGQLHTLANLSSRKNWGSTKSLAPAE